ncbi:MAG: hypothetical protein Q7T97_12065 [Burkholderiaceae bacterium]|nr:hypothetical protein [Burkholderiaceae bacterium]
MNMTSLPAQTDTTDAPAGTTTTTHDAPAKKRKPAPAVKAASPSKARVTSQPAAKKSKAPKVAVPVARKAPKAVVKRPAKPKALVDDKAPKVKAKLIRDSFTMPQTDFDLIDMLKQRALDFRHSAKKSELLRAGLQVLAALPHAQLQAALERITPLKPGRPKNAD